jgi:O-acetyl-ADP-ribose deacetylase (regulator of RNase III)
MAPLLFRNPMDVVKGDLLDVKHGIIAHACNGQRKMGSGIAAQIKEKFPEAYVAYKNGSMALGTTTFVEPEPDLWVVNCVTQEKYGNPGTQRFTSYDAVEVSMTKINTLCEAILQQRGYAPSVHFPKFGAYRGGAKWPIIQRIIECSIHTKFRIHVHYPMTLPRGAAYDFTPVMNVHGDEEQDDGQNSSGE